MTSDRRFAGVRLLKHGLFLWLENNVETPDL